MSFSLEAFKEMKDRACSRTFFYGLSASQAQKDSSLLPNNLYKARVLTGRTTTEQTTNLYIFQCAGRIVWGEECIYLLNAQEEVTPGFRDDTFSSDSSPAAMISMGPCACKSLKNITELHLVS